MNDYVELMLDVQGDVPRRVKLPALKSPVGDVRIIERKTHLVIEVAKKKGLRLGLRGYSAASADERVSRYEFERDVTSVKAVVHFGLKRMADGMRGARTSSRPPRVPTSLTGRLR